MIVDFHTHLAHPDIVSQSFWDGWAEVAALVANRPIERVKRRMPEFYDLSGDVIIQDMDKAGIDASVLLVNDWGTARYVGEAKLNIEEINRLYGDVAKRYPGRLVAFAGIDPRRPRAAERIESFIKNFDMKGIKLHPSVGYFPNDKICYPIYEKAAELGVPIVFHTGEMLKPFYFKYTQPVHLQEVAMDFPEIPMVFAHAGGCWQNEAVAICSNCTNVYLDVSLWQAKFLHPLEFYRNLRSLLNSVSWQRVLFGSDSPVLRLMVSQEKWVKAFTEIPESVKGEGIEFPKEAIDAIMGGNAAKLLKLGG